MRTDFWALALACHAIGHAAAPVMVGMDPEPRAADNAGLRHVGPGQRDHAGRDRRTAGGQGSQGHHDAKQSGGVLT